MSINTHHHLLYSYSTVPSKSKSQIDNDNKKVTLTDPRLAILAQSQNHTYTTVTDPRLAMPAQSQNHIYIPQDGNSSPVTKPHLQTPGWQC